MLDLERFAASHHATCLHSVIQFLEIFEWDSKIEAELREIVNKMGIPIDVPGGGRAEPHQRELLMITLKDRTCPECDHEIKAARIPSCEKARTGRVWYEECTKCTYYKEEFKS